ncbi:MAG: FAD/NAD(P)-binding protein [Acidimicrobiales bacterium]|nr:FAD/NAD(P)-binding protein [Acidimicrobiales bacterium]
MAEALAPTPMTPTVAPVVWRRDENDDTVTLGVERVGAAPAPGQFHMLWAFGVGEVPISVSRVDGDVVQHTIRTVGPVSQALASCAAGDVVGVRGPFGRGWDLDAARGGDVIVAAGGLGIAPLRPAIDALIAERDAFGRVCVLIGARSPAQLLYPDELAVWRARFDLDVALTVDTADRSWRGDVGVVTKLVPRAPFDPARTTALVCGPEVMMRFMAQSLVDRGVDPDRIQVSLERNMKCGIAQCGHCQLGPLFVCADGPVVRWSVAAPLARIRER